MAKEETIYVRMPAEIKERLQTIADDRGETLSVIVREACREYFTGPEDPNPKPKAPVASGAVGNRGATKYPSLRHK